LSCIKYYKEGIILNFLVTAGGTIEKIDAVRAITNKSTGQLGKLIAETLNCHCPDAKIFYLCAETSEIPNIKNLTIIRIISVADAEQAMHDLFKKINFDIIIHAMAISDYVVANVTSAEKIYNAIKLQNTESIENIVDIEKILHSESLSFSTEQKIDSTEDSLILVLKKAPKLIAIIRKKQPQCVLVGFKLMVSVSKDILMATAVKLLEKNGCNLVFANDLQNVLNINEHKGMLIKPDGTYIATSTKQNSAETIVIGALQCLKLGGFI